MAEAILKGILKSGAIGASEITALEKNPERAEYIEDQYKIKFQHSFCDLVINSGHILIAVKPADIVFLLEDIKSFTDLSNNVFISIAAGVPISFYEKMLPGNPAVIRVMPNTPALVGKGMSVISCGRHVKKQHIDFVEKLTGSIGRYIIMEEKFQNAVTAISGSGPAYFFLFCRHLAETAKKLGIDSENAARLVAFTALGAGKMLDKYESDADYLIKMVASPGGTTEAALREFESGGFADIIEKAVERAYNKAVQIQDAFMGGSKEKKY
jgi:pyrroline-5-carboxylate reductase